MSINKFNYEAFALDYLEGNLSPEMVEEMELFLKTYPAIESELSGMMELVTLEADTSIVYEDKNRLLKPERVIWLQKRWIRPLMAAASFALLLTTYFMGYQAGAGEHNGAGQIVVENGNSNSKSSLVIEKIESVGKINKKVVAKAIIATTKMEEKKPIKVQKNNVKAIYQPIERSSIVEDKIVVVAKEISNYPIEKIPVLTTNSLMLPSTKEEIAQLEQITTTALTSLVATNLMQTKISSTTTNFNDLTNVLAADLPLDRVKLAQQLKRKRSFKDFLGKFPVNNLREALIPSYYREESTGQ